MNKIERFEALAERLVEGTFIRLFAGRLRPLEVVTHLVRAMEDHQAPSPDGVPQAPTHYWVYLNPADCVALATERQALEIELAHDVTELAAQSGLEIQVTPSVRLLPDENVAAHQVRVDARWMPGEASNEVKEESTREMEPDEDKDEVEDESAAIPPGRPFLIIQGQRHVNLVHPVVSVGRSLDNDIIVDDPRVSRRHAQLRRRYGRYVLYDLSSSGGTKINGYPIEECVLHSGDVISFAGVQVIYGEDPPTPIPLPNSQDTPTLAYEHKNKSTP